MSQFEFFVFVPGENQLAMFDFILCVYRYIPVHLQSCRFTIGEIV